jgi:hypothetical protein
MSGRRGAVVGILLLGLLWSAGDAEATWWLLNLKRTPGTVSGQVQVACGDPKGVLVYLAGRSFIAFTDAGGQFVLDWVPPGTYVLHVETVEPAAVHETAIKVLSGRDTNVGTIQLGPDLQTDEQHCGACNTQCAADQTCQAGTCVPTQCAPGTADCDGDAANGCEASLATVQNCGACGNACTNNHGTTACSANGVCQPTCSAGFGNCDLNAANGCETSLTSDQNCGACGLVCGLGTTCQGGRCAPLVCPPGFGNCDLNAANGCETSLTTDQNCGGCGLVCAPGSTCQSGVCQ